MSMHRISTLATASALAFLTAGCVVAPPRERVTYAQPPMQRQAPVYAEYGRVENIGYVQVSQRPSGAGALLGAVIGGVVGNRFGAGGGRALATGVGAVGGALVGNAIENQNRSLRDGEIYRVQVRFDNGNVRDFDFQRIDDLRSGDRVKFEDGQLHRL